jgi:hypothetical protein
LLSVKASEAELQVQVDDEREARQGFPTRLDESAVAALDAAAKGPAFDLDLLSTSPVRDIRMQIEATVALLDRMDHRVLLNRQGVFSRLTGADVEARLEFELASQEVLASVRQLRQAAENGRRIRTLLKEARDDTAGQQTHLESIIAAARELLAASRDAEQFVVARFERRLASIMAMHTANVLTIEQMNLADGVLTGLLDRLTDVDTLLFPLWQRNVLAVAHSSGGRSHRAAVDKFAECHESLVARLKQDATA